MGIALHAVPRQRDIALYLSRSAGERHRHERQHELWSPRGSCAPQCSCRASGERVVQRWDHRGHRGLLACPPRADRLQRLLRQRVGGGVRLERQLCRRARLYRLDLRCSSALKLMSPGLTSGSFGAFLLILGGVGGFLLAVNKTTSKDAEGYTTHLTELEEQYEFPPEPGASASSRRVGYVPPAV